MFVALLAFLLAAAQPPAASPTPSPAAADADRVLLFLVDNSASLPPLDPEKKRTEALERIFSFLEGQAYRLVLFGGRREIFVDDISRYRNNGQWTDIYFAFEKARELMTAYPAGTEFRIVVLTDGIVDPDPRDWADMGVPEGESLKAFSSRRLIELIRELDAPLYVILVGNPPSEGVAPGDREQSPELILEMIRAANGARASATAQTLAAFFADDGMLLRKFVYRVAPHEGLLRLEPIVRRIVAESSPGVELKLLSASVLPLALFLCLLLGILVRSFPGPGDLEVLELAKGVPVHVAVDRFHKVQAGWGTTGLSLVADAKDAAATLTYQPPPLDLTSTGFDTGALDDTTRRLLPLGVEELKKALFELQTSGSKDEKVYVLNLDYMAKNLDAREAERILTTPTAMRHTITPAELLRAKAHLVGNDALRQKLLAPRVHVVSYGKEAERRDLQPGARVRIGRYGFVVGEVTRGGRKEVRLNLFYDRVPSLLGLKTILPGAFQRIFRLRSTAQRVVS